MVETVRPGTRSAVAAISAREGAHVARLVDRGVAHVAVEVAIRALRQAERPVDVDAEGVRLARQRRSRHASASLRNARARCDSACLSAAPCFSSRSSRRMYGHSRRAGTSDRSRNPGRRAAARPACRRRGPRILHMAVRPGDAQHRDEMRLALLRRERVALAQHRPRPSPSRGGNPWPGRPSAPNRCRARRRAHRPPGRNRRRTPASPVACAAASRLEPGIGREGGAGLLRLGELNSPAETASTP